MVRLRLYIAGQSGPSRAALATIESLRNSVTGAVQIEIVDVLERPDAAEDARVLATPTLDRVEPWPTRRIIGDLGDLRNITETFDLELGDEGIAVSSEGSPDEVADQPKVALESNGA